MLSIDTIFKFFSSAGILTLLIGIPATAQIEKIKNIVGEAKKSSAYELKLPTNDPALPSGDLSSLLDGFGRNAVTAFATNGIDLMVGGAGGELNLIHPSGRVENLTGLLGIQNKLILTRVNAIGYVKESGFWIVGGTVLGDQGKPARPLLVKLIPDGLKTQNLEAEAKKLKLKEISYISCGPVSCVLTAEGGRVIIYDGIDFKDVSIQFGFNTEDAPKVTTNNLVWMIAGVISDAEAKIFTIRIYSFDGKIIKVLNSGDKVFESASPPAIDVGSKNGAWLVAASGETLLAFTLQGSEFILEPIFSITENLEPVIGIYKNHWILGGGASIGGLRVANTLTKSAADANLLVMNKELRDANILVISQSPVSGVLIGGKREGLPFLLHAN